jgi:2,4-dienoyl-CoA reductase [(3E)-enoyl-CoA-producing], peroxisomal
LVYGWPGTGSNRLESEISPAYGAPMTVFADSILAGHTALVTGGGTGICHGIARAYLAHGARVAITSRKREVLDAAALDLARDTGGEVLAIAADVRDPAQVEAAVAATLERFGALDTVVNGAAGNFLAPAATLSPNGFRTVIDIDLCGTFNVSRAAFEALRRSGDGLVLNLSATLQSHGTPLQGHAAAAKAGVDALTRTLAVEWGGSGIRVNAIAPGAIGDTEGMRRLAPGDLGDRFRKTIPLGRFGAVREIADMAVFLRSSAAAYITGTVIVIDGGQSVAPAGF